MQAGGRVAGLGGGLPCAAVHRAMQGHRLQVTHLKRCPSAHQDCLPSSDPYINMHPSWRSLDALGFAAPIKKVIRSKGRPTPSHRPRFTHTAGSGGKPLPKWLRACARPNPARPTESGPATMQGASSTGLSFRAGLQVGGRAAQGPPCRFPK
jgi:hypothetical protein